MEEAVIADKPKSKRVNGTEPFTRVVPWWDHVWAPHPMTDQQFVDAFCQFVLCKSDDHSLKTVRQRAYYFIRNFMSPEIAKSLVAYREVYPV